MLLNAFYYIFVFLVIGVPIWCLTTTTYRAALPFDEIDSIYTAKKLDVNIKINLIYLSEVKDDKLSTIKNDFEEIINNDKPSSGLTFDFKVNVRKSCNNEMNSVEQSNKIEGSYQLSIFKLK